MDLDAALIIHVINGHDGRRQILLFPTLVALLFGNVVLNAEITFYLFLDGSDVGSDCNIGTSDGLFMVILEDKLDVDILSNGVSGHFKVNFHFLNDRVVADRDPVLRLLGRGLQALCFHSLQSNIVVFKVNGLPKEESVGLPCIELNVSWQKVNLWRRIFQKVSWILDLQLERRTDRFVRPLFLVVLHAIVTELSQDVNIESLLDLLFCRARERRISFFIVK